MNSTLILITSIAEYLIMGVLFLLSIWSISIIIDRKKVLQQESNFNFDKYKAALAENSLRDLKNQFSNESNFVIKGLKQALDVLANSNSSGTLSEQSLNSFTTSVDRRLSSYIKEERLRLEKGLSVLATLGANAAFIGLFGTVLGIIRSFAYLGSQSGSQAVMSGVSQALYATAIGLFVAIPAVVAYNIYTKKIKTLILQTESLRDELIAQAILNNKNK